MLLTFVLMDILEISRAVDGIIWSKGNQDFVPLFSISTFLTLENERLRKSRDLEYHNFHKEVLKISYFQEENLVSFVDNDTKMSGVCGEVWTILADYLNFTLIPIKLTDKNFGFELDNGTFTGLLGLIQQNQSQIVPRSGIFRSRTMLLDYTIPLWTIRYHLYIKPEWSHDGAWMFHLFSIKLWYSFFFLLLVLSVAGYVCEKYSPEESNEVIHCNLQDHVFYTVAIASSQGCVPPEVQNKSRIIYICTCMFSWIILIAFSSHAIYLMMNKKYILPFNGLKDLIQESKYDVVAFSGSQVHRDFERTVALYYKHTQDRRRVSYAHSAEEVYGKVCFNEKKKYAAFEAEDRHKAIGKNICRLVPTSAYYFETWIASAIKRGFEYKRSFDVGILKLSETGLIDGLKDRWLDWKLEENEELPFQSIDMNQVWLIFGILLVGLTTSIFILLIEYLTYFKNKILTGRVKQNKVQTVVKFKPMITNENYAFFATR